MSKQSNEYLKNWRKKNRDKIRKYNQSPEVQKRRREWHKKYNEEYLKDPNIKIKRRNYQRIYLKRDYVKTKLKQKRYDKKKASCVICDSSAPSKYCSNKCHGIGIILNNNPNWKEGKSFEPYPISWDNKFRKSIRHRDNNTYMRCRRHRNMFIRELSVHHINGIKNDVRSENCISLCIHCHLIVEGSGSYRYVYDLLFKKMLSSLYGYKIF